MSPKHPYRYVDEFSFRRNDGNVEIHIMEQSNALLFGPEGKRITYKELTGKEQDGR
uniref:Uncharacterized protein n=1 Tax=Candidatus Kentrum sp. LPFa TaxID=2126335 RepID=A0A450W1L4_9GAMM|nr:MAG: hypothetical protein BECKLPF1236A_GA0070988_100468 [Candidatus Kentron sp. LPFa]VFK28348.1 MAG: hypothetical protein BECKLPF1236C_GA0070990_100638 [Candidatus Kentron sp. LPFa]